MSNILPSPTFLVYYWPTAQDQSISSVILKQIGVIDVPREAELNQTPKKWRYPFWASRMGHQMGHMPAMYCERNFTVRENPTINRKRSWTCGCIQQNRTTMHWWQIGQYCEFT